MEERPVRRFWWWMKRIEMESLRDRKAPEAAEDGWG
jgi:hypothetical protein